MNNFPNGWVMNPLNVNMQLHVARQIARPSWPSALTLDIRCRNAASQFGFFPTPNPQLLRRNKMHKNTPSKASLINMIDLFSAWAMDDLHITMTFERYSPAWLESRSALRAHNLCAGRLAKSLGLASMTWDKPEALKIAA